MAPGSSMAATNRRTSSVSDDRPLASNMARSPEPEPSSPSSARSATPPSARKTSMYDERWRWSSSAVVPAADRRHRRRRRRRRGDGAPTPRVRVRTRSGWRPATTQATIAPQSWPTRSKRSRPHGVGDGQDVGDELVDAVVLHRGGPGSGRIAPLVEGERPVAGRAEGVELVVPRERGLGEAVEEEHGPAVGAGPVATASNVSPLAVTSRSCTGRLRRPGLGGVEPPAIIDRHAESRPRTSAGVERNVSSDTAPAMAPLLGVVMRGGLEQRGPPGHQVIGGAAEEAEEDQGQLDVLGHRGPAEHRGAAAAQ